MCFYGKKNWWQRNFNTSIKPKIATKDIEVYKMLTSLGNGILVSPFQEARYQIGVEKRADMLNIYKEGSSEHFRVEEGLHSYSSLRTARERRCWHTNIYKAIIPKGSEYFIGLDNEVVSKHLIITEIAK